MGYLEKPTATSLLLDSAPPMAKPAIKLTAKRKQRQPAKKYTTKCVKWGNKEVSQVSLVFNKARRRQMAEDLFFWCTKCQETCISSLTICSLTLLKTE